MLGSALNPIVFVNTSAQSSTVIGDPVIVWLSVPLVIVSDTANPAFDGSSDVMSSTVDPNQLVQSNGGPDGSEYVVPALVSRLVVVATGAIAATGSGSMSSVSVDVAGATLLSDVL